jgi:DNA replication protein DnaC
VVFLGPPGVGKTHLAIGLAIAAAHSGRRVYYGSLADLINSLEEAQASGRLQQRLKVLTRTGAMLFFQLMSRRYEHASTVLTSNKSFEEWGEIYGDEVMAAALIDRLLHHCHIVNICGNSYRVRNLSHLWKQPDPQAESAGPRRRRRRSSRLQEEGRD